MRIIFNSGVGEQLRLLDEQQRPHGEQRLAEQRQLPLGSGGQQLAEQRRRRPRGAQRPVRSEQPLARRRSLDASRKRSLALERSRKRSLALERSRIGSLGM